MEEALQNKNRQDLNINISLRLMIQTSRASDDGGKGRRGVDTVVNADLSIIGSG